jgi:hypothetical protein
MMGHFSIRPSLPCPNFPPTIPPVKPSRRATGYRSSRRRSTSCSGASHALPRAAVEQCRSVRTKIHLLLHLGYFRARQRFFRFELPAVRDDVDYLRRRYFDNVAVADLTVSLHTRQRHIEVILVALARSFARNY